MRRHGHRLATTRHHWHFWRRETPIGVRVRVACQSVDIVLRWANEWFGQLHGGVHCWFNEKHGKQRQDHRVHHPSTVEWDIRAFRSLVPHGRGTCGIRWRLKHGLRLFLKVVFGDTLSCILLVCSNFPLVRHHSQGMVCPSNYNPSDFYIKMLAISPAEKEKCEEKVKVSTVKFTVYSPITLSADYLHAWTFIYVFIGNMSKIWRERVLNSHRRRDQRSI